MPLVVEWIAGAVDRVEAMRAGGAIYRLPAHGHAKRGGRRPCVGRKIGMVVADSGIHHPNHIRARSRRCVPRQGRANVPSGTRRIPQRPLLREGRIVRRRRRQPDNEIRLHILDIGMLPVAGKQRRDALAVRFYHLQPDPASDIGV